MRGAEGAKGRTERGDEEMRGAEGAKGRTESGDEGSRYGNEGRLRGDQRRRVKYSR